MGFKENLKAKIHLDNLLRKAVHSIKEPPEKRLVDKELTREILDMTDFEYRKGTNLHLYVRPLENGIMEILVLDNELPIYHTTVADVTLRKSPHWQDVFSIRNIRRIMNDQDIIVSRGKESLKRVHAVALGRLDLTYTRDDLDQLIKEGIVGLEQGSLAKVREALDLFFELLGFQAVYFASLEPDLQMFGRSAPEAGAARSFEHLIILNEKTLSLGLRKGAFSPTKDSDLEWVAHYAQKQKRADFHGVEVFEFLADLALAQERRYPQPSAVLVESRI